MCPRVDKVNPLKTKFLLTYLTSVLLSISMLSEVNAQRYALDVKQIGIEDGLSDRDVLFVLQDQQGVIWMGTRNGLNRYDGEGVSIYFSGADASVREFNQGLLDANGMLWLFETGSVISYKAKNIVLFDPALLEEVALNEIVPAQYLDDMEHVLAFDQTADGHIHFITESGLRLKYDGIKFEANHIDLRAMNVNSFRVLADGGLCLIVEEFQGEDKVNYIESIHLYNAESEYISSNTLDGLDQAFFIRHLEEPLIIVYNEEQSSIYRVDQAYNLEVDAEWTAKLNEVTEDRQASLLQFSRFAMAGPHLWVSTFYLLDMQSSLNLYSSAVGNLADIQAEVERIKHVNDLYVDHEGRLWVGTQFGLYILQMNEQRFDVLMRSESDELRPFRNIVVWDDSTLLVAPEREMDLVFCDIHTGEERTLGEECARFDLKKTAGFDNTVVKSKNGAVIYSKQYELTLFDPESCQAQSITFEGTQSYDASSIIWSIHECKAGGYIFGTNHGTIAKVEPGKELEILGLPDENTFVYYFAEVSADRMLVATSQGLLLIDPYRMQLIQRFWQGGVDGEHLHEDDLYHLHMDGDSALWLATKLHGLVRLGVKWSQGRMSIADKYVLDEESGLANNTIYAVYPDDYGKLWMSSDNGVLAYDQRDSTVRQYGVLDGLEGLEFNRISHAQDTAGRIYFGGLNGVTMFDPADFREDERTDLGEVYLSDVALVDKVGVRREGVLAALRAGGELIVEPGDRYFKVDFALINYDLDKNIRYAYKVEGLDHQWHDLTENSLRINRLPYGRTHLLIHARESGGGWASDPLRIPIYVIRPFYAQGWFYALLVVLGLLGIMALVRYRTKRLLARQTDLQNQVRQRTQKISEDKILIQAQANHLRALDHQKTAFFANLTHELRTPISLLLGPLQSVLAENNLSHEQSTLLHIAEKNSRKLLDLVNQVLDLSKLEHGVMPTHSTWLNLYDYMQDLLPAWELKAQSQAITLTYTNTLPPKTDIFVDPEMFEKIIRNLLSNALKFADNHDGQVSIDIGGFADLFYVSVNNNGPAIPPHQINHVFNRYFQTSTNGSIGKGGSGIGLAIVKQTARLLSGKIEVQSSPTEGTTFTFTCPIEKRNTQQESNGDQV